MPQHDIGVKVSGDIVQYLNKHFIMYWNEVVNYQNSNKVKGVTLNSIHLEPGKNIIYKDLNFDIQNIKDEDEY